MNANFCQHLAVREQGSGGERERSRLQEKDGGIEDLEKQTGVEKVHICSVVERVSRSLSKDTNITM